jgi:hypothetical protein
MAEQKDREAEKKGKSRVHAAVLSLIVPGLGQIVRGRVFAGLFFLMNAVLYLGSLFIPHHVGYDVRTPAALVLIGVWIAAALDAFLYRTSFLVLALLVSLFSFGTGFFGALYILPGLDI